MGVGSPLILTQSHSSGPVPGNWLRFWSATLVACQGDSGIRAFSGSSAVWLGLRCSLRLRTCIGPR